MDHLIINRLIVKPLIESGKISFNLFLRKQNAKIETDIVLSAKKIPKNIYKDKKINPDLSEIDWESDAIYNKFIEYQKDDKIPDLSTFINFYNEWRVNYTLSNFGKRLANELKTMHKDRTSETYRAAVSSFLRWRGGSDIHLARLSSVCMNNYENSLIEQGLTYNTISFYMRILRAIYNRAVEEGAISDRNIFKKVFTGAETTRKRALRVETLKKIKNLDLSDSPSLGYARDMFMLSFYLRGMALVDMAYLKTENYHEGMIEYRRRKTGKLLKIEWTAEMEAIRRRYSHTKNGYFLPIMHETSGTDRSVYKNMSTAINHSLRELGRKIGMDFPLTMYVARHSWATIARLNNIPISVISEGMGHSSEKMTRIYLASLENSIIDKANSLIIDSLK